MKKTITILYVHGFNGSGSGSTSTTISKLLPNDGRIKFITHDFSNNIEDVRKNIDTINELVDLHNTEIIIASSLGGFETMHSNYGPCKLLINPTFNPLKNLPAIIQLSDEEIKSFKEIGEITEANFTDKDKGIIYGFFGTEDEICNYQAEFREIFGEKYMTIVNDGHVLNETNLKKVVDKAVEIADSLLKDQNL